MKKFLKVFSIIAVIAVALACSTYFFLPSVFYGYVYPFSRIKGNITLTIDGRDVPLSDCEITCEHSQESQKVHVNGNRIKTRAGKYGGYNYKIRHGDTEVRFYVYQYNCWNCADFDVTFNVLTSKNVVTCTGSCTSLGENGFGPAEHDTHNIESTLTLDYEQSQWGICILSV